LFQKRLREIGADFSQIVGYSPMGTFDKDLLGSDLTRAASAQAPLIAEKDWVLLGAPVGSNFFLSDSPLTMTNTLNRDPLTGTVGLAVPGIELYLPLTPKLCLAMYCPTVSAWLIENQNVLLTRKWLMGLA